MLDTVSQREARASQFQAEVSQRKAKISQLRAKWVEKYSDPRLVFQSDSEMDRREQIECYASITAMCEYSVDSELDQLRRRDGITESEELPSDTQEQLELNIRFVALYEYAVRSFYASMSKSDRWASREVASDCYSFCKRFAFNPAYSDSELFVLIDRISQSSAFETLVSNQSEFSDEVFQSLMVGERRTTAVAKRRL